jgi:hypothetical protein
VFGPGLELGVGNCPFLRQVRFYSIAMQSPSEKCSEKCNDHAKSESNADTGNHRHCKQCLCPIHHLRHFGGAKFHFLLVSLKNHPRRSGKTLTETLAAAKYLFIAASDCAGQANGCQRPVALRRRWHTARKPWSIMLNTAAGDSAIF